MERLGFRSSSGPFDWVVTYKVEAIIELIENHFEGFMDYKNLYQNEQYLNIYKDTKYKVQFNHDFVANQSLIEQLEEVKAKYKRRIERFYEEINAPTLFIRYIISNKEKEYFENSYESVVQILKKYNEKNELVLVAHEDMVSSKIKIYNVVRDTGITTTLYPIQKNADLYNYIIAHYDDAKLKKNLEFIKNKEFVHEKPNTLKKRVIERIRGTKTYVHEQQYRDE